MKLIRFVHTGETHTGVVTPTGIAPVLEINTKKGTRVPNDLLSIIKLGTTAALADLDGVTRLPFDRVTPLVPYDVPPKIWCIGLNYKSHAVDINAVQPEEPGSFMKPASCIMQPNGTIQLPPTEIASEIDAEGELGVIIGKSCRFLDPDQVADAIFGYTTTLDLTALDVLRKNPRYLTRSKSFDTFFSFGPIVVTRDEVAHVDQLEVVTEHNGRVFSKDFVSNMHTRPFELVRFHSDYMTLHPGDLISTGCPKGARIQPGDRVRAFIEGVGELSASVAPERQTKRPRLG
jgi:2-keto-4-pentenoate hydratase/2-oxohepta-3-ene-1,7-dioic acid hydratase in catechol pathway